MKRGVYLRNIAFNLLPFLLQKRREKLCILQHNGIKGAYPDECCNEQQNSAFETFAL